MKTIIFLLLFPMLTCCTMFQHGIVQSQNESTCSIDAQVVISISKILLDQHEIANQLSYYSNVSDTFFVRNPFDTASIIDTAISYKKEFLENKVILFYDHPELIGFQKRTWLEFVTIMQEQQGIVVEGSVIVTYPKSFTVSKFNALFNCTDSEVKLMSLKITSPPE